MDKMDFYTALSPTVLPLLKWYQAGHRDLPWRQNPTPYQVWISEIMLQQTRVQAVIPYYHRFLSLFPDVAALAQAPEEQLLKAWEGLGYYSRARNLQRAARIICDRFDGGCPTGYDDWLALPGVGPYTAGAVCSIALGLPVPAVDGNVLRVFSRLLALEEDIAAPAVKKELTALAAALIPPDAPGEYNQALMELGATVCLPNGTPLCQSCPISGCCRAFQEQNQMLFPLKSPKKPRKILKMTVFLVENQGRWALNQRPEKGLLAGLWEFPNTAEPLDREQAAAYLNRWVRPAGEPVPLSPAAHVFTHLEWHMTAWKISADQVLPDCPFIWAKPEEIQKIYPIPSAFSAFTPICIVQNNP